MPGVDGADGMPDDAVRALLRTARRIAVVGLSRRPDRPSNRVFRFLAARSIELVGVNPLEAGEAIDGRPVVATLREAARILPSIDVVDVFRRASEVGPIVDDAIAVGARAVWMQLGIVSPQAAATARAAGLATVMDRCPVIEWRRLGLPLARAPEERAPEERAPKGRGA